MKKTNKGANRITGEFLRNIDKEEIIKDFYRVIDLIGHIPTREEYLNYGKYSRAPIKRIFGGHNELLRYLKLEVRMSRGDATREEVLEDAKELIKKFGKLDAITHRKYGKYSQIITDKFFGSFSGMMRELGLKSQRDTRLVSNDDLMMILIDVRDRYGKVTVNLLKMHTDIPYQTFRNRFGTFEDILKTTKTKSLFGISKTSKLVLDSISLYLNSPVIFEKTFDFLVNPDTGARLYIDGYIEKYNLAIEYDGIQHFFFTPYFHKSYEDFEYRQKLDKLKNDILTDNGINIIRFRFDESISLNHIKKRLSETINI